MPKEKEYLKGFGLYNGMELAGYILDRIELKHETVSTYKEYRYPIVMHWRNVNGRDNSELINALNDHVSEDKVIYTQYGNPYQCHFGRLDHHYENGDHLVVNAIGYCQRI